ncbi:MAG: class I SAM-dependent methyltransferase [Lachnospiraceae bacterium]|uniref:Class I SAM-dependent methyltransferase n=1 Tax=Candidatus Enterocloster excrementigallinarum TaxID=2838558 RepID=A0A9D2PZ09_9FIRM|nr:class I SAM-dependent methyltransferase [Lachnospiraceae bacterium]HJC67845.1 class I SAM-dependent methyltransferase [Candidatus Enterocloster excrementigallinarum]
MSTYAQENITYWTRRAPSYSDVNQEELGGSQHSVWSRVIDQRIQSHFGNRSRDQIRLLDVGTGPGFFAIILAELGYQVTAVDYTEAMLNQARKNAGPLASIIDFRRMDAEQLTFPDGAFDVIVSRNLTWNLPSPAKAYSQWTRVLKENGLLLNFDANWYRYLFNAQANALHLEDRKNVRENNAADDTAGTDVDAMEAIARQAPLSARRRPAWDIHVLHGLGMSVFADPEIWKQVWTENERINNASTPMFLVHAVKAS